MTRAEQKQRRDEVIRLVKSGTQAREIAARFNLTVQSVYEICKYEGIKFKDFVRLQKKRVAEEIDYSRREITCKPKNLNPNHRLTAFPYTH
jgi:transposase